MNGASKNDWSRGPFRAELRCRLEFTGPLHVGTGEALSLHTDAPVLRDAADGVWLPGSSVRGVLADWCHREAPLLGVHRASVQRLFGVTPKRGEGSPEDDRQGRLTVPDVELRGGTEQIRDHVRIDRETGAAARGGKFDHEVAHPSGGTLTLIYEGDSPNDPELVLLQSAADALNEGLLAFGGKTGWGLGAARVGADSDGSSGLAWSLVDRKERSDLSAYLGARLPRSDSRQNTTTAASDAGTRAPAKTVPRVAALTNCKSRDHEPGEPPPWSWLRLRLRLAFDGTMLVAALDATASASRTSMGRNDFTEERSQADATYQVGPDGCPVLAGSALRGPLRSDADRIEKTLGLHRLAKTLFGTDKTQGLIRVQEGVLDGDPHPVLLNHVSIDRVTGFAATTRLFNAAALASPCFHSELLLRWHAQDDSHRQAVALLFFVLRDAEHQGLWIGSRTTRGYGHAKQVRIEEARWSLVGVPNGRSQARDASPTRLAGALHAPTTVAQLTGCLGFVQQAWTDALPKPEPDASPHNPEGVPSGTAD